MIWLDRLNEAIDYIESHLDGTIDLKQAAQKACCSVYHLQRMFPFIGGITLSEYIRRRRLTLAAFDLKKHGVKVVEVAARYGYESPEAFSRAFRNLHGVMPTAVRHKDTVLKAYPQIVFSLSVKGNAEMSYRIEKKQSFEVFGISTTIHLVNDRAYSEVPEYWNRCVADGTYDRIKAVTGREQNYCVNGALFNTRGDVFSYMMCDFMPLGGLPKELEMQFESLYVPEMTWVIFPLDQKDGRIGEQVIHIWKRLYTEWFPTSGFDHADGPDFEMYFDKGDGIYAGEVWVPVIKSAKGGDETA